MGGSKGRIMCSCLTPHHRHLTQVASEDPFHLSEFIYEYARGLQEGEDDRSLKLISTAKHWSGVR